MYRHNSFDSPEASVVKRQHPHSASARRPVTVYERRVSASPNTASLQQRGRSSPLKRFREAKDSISHAFRLIREELVKVTSFLDSAHGEDGKKKVSALLDKTHGIEDILSRDHMKVKACSISYDCSLSCDLAGGLFWPD